jgi:hypothetical protein
MYLNTMLYFQYNVIYSFKEIADPQVWIGIYTYVCVCVCVCVRERERESEKVVGLELGPLSLVNTTEELLDRKVAAPV